jgi:hypothetical protein
VEDVRAVFVNQDAMLVIAIVRITADVIAAIDEQNFFVHSAGKALSEHTPSETGTDNEVIKHMRDGAF